MNAITNPSISAKMTNTKEMVGTTAITPAPVTTPQDITRVLQDKFKSGVCDTSEDVAGQMSCHFAHISETGDSVFNINKRNARRLLHLCKHTLPTEKAQIDYVFKLKEVLGDDGIKSMWPVKPIRINVSTNTIEHGTEELFALAISQAYGTYMPMEFVN